MAGSNVLFNSCVTQIDGSILLVGTAGTDGLSVALGSNGNVLTMTTFTGITLLGVSLQTKNGEQSPVAVGYTNAATTALRDAVTLFLNHDGTLAIDEASNAISLASPTIDMLRAVTPSDYDGGLFFTGQTAVLSLPYQTIICRAEAHAYLATSLIPTGLTSVNRNQLTSSQSITQANGTLTIAHLSAQSAPLNTTIITGEVGIAWQQSRTDAPTSQPSGVPTGNPSGGPTSQPVASPTGRPSRIPTRTPSGVPTGHPSGEPTNQPVASPTNNPTGRPSRIPTRTPSGVPTGHPSGEPTNQPVASPTNNPTGRPSRIPTRTPSGLPTGNPSAAPTSIPVASPTSSPTGKPSRIPTYSPTSQPTIKPTLIPSLSPTISPTWKPITISPTANPSRTPTVRPTSSPTARPSGIPTRNPSSVPTSNPSGVPTSQPVASPTGNPTGRPSRIPTRTPSAVPTCLPTTKPTDKPSLKPTYLPSLWPTFLPTRKPSTMSPTTKPSAALTERPTKSGDTVAPTVIPTQPPTIGLIANWTKIDGLPNTILSVVDIVQDFEYIFDVLNIPYLHPASLLTFYDKETGECNPFYLPWSTSSAAVSQDNQLYVTGTNSNGFSIVANVDVGNQRLLWAKILPWSFYKVVSLNINTANNLEFTMQSFTYSDSGNIWIGELEQATGQVLSSYSYASILSPPQLSATAQFSIPCLDDSCTYVTGSSSASNYNSIFIMRATKSRIPDANFYQLASKIQARYDQNQASAILSDANSLYILGEHTRNSGSQLFYSISKFFISANNTLSMENGWPKKTSTFLNDMIVIQNREKSSLIVCGSSSRFADKLNTPQLVVIELDSNGNVLRGLRIKSINKLSCEKLTKTYGGFVVNAEYYENSKTTLAFTAFVDQETFMPAPLPFGFSATSDDVLNIVQFALSDLVLQSSIPVSSQQEGLLGYQDFTGNFDLVPVANFNAYYNVAPSIRPSVAPSFGPSIQLSKFPSFTPSWRPSQSPTFRPSRQPTSQRPSFNPTISLQPTLDGYTYPPTDKPTELPTGIPSGKPTGKPTDKPTGKPTGNPTIRPTGKPTKIPSRVPTKMLTQSPSFRPSLSPTKRPAAPTFSPSTRSPTSGSPTGFPSGVPTRFFAPAKKAPWSDVFTKNAGYWVFGAFGFAGIVVYLLDSGAFRALVENVAALNKKKKNRILPVPSIIERVGDRLEINDVEQPADAEFTSEQILEEIYVQMIKRDIMMEYICKKIEGTTKKERVTISNIYGKLNAIIKREYITPNALCEELAVFVKEDGPTKKDKLNEIRSVFYLTIKDAMDEISSNQDASFEKLLEIAANYILIKKTIMTSILKHVLTEQEKMSFLQDLSDSDRMHLYCKTKKKGKNKIKNQRVTSLEQKSAISSEGDVTSEELGDKDQEQSNAWATSPESTLEIVAMDPNDTLTQYSVTEETLWDVSSDSSDDDKYQLASDSDDEIEKAKMLAYPLTEISLSIDTTEQDKLSDNSDDKYQLPSDSDDDIEKAKFLIYPEIVEQSSSNPGSNTMSLFKKFSAVSEDSSKKNDISLDVWIKIMK